MAVYAFSIGPFQTPASTNSVYFHVTLMSVYWKLVLVLITSSKIRHLLRNYSGSPDNQTEAILKI
jgi:hypothetical protein